MSDDGTFSEFKASDWLDDLSDAIKDAWEKSKDPGKTGRQYFRIAEIQLRGENPVREYRVFLSGIPTPPGG